jgi:hypothetical protein
MQVKEHPVEQEEVMAFLDGELAADRAAVVARHLEECGECGRLAGELRGVSGRLAGWEVERPRVRLPVRRKKVAISTWGLGLAAAGLLAVLLVAPKTMHQSVGARLAAAKLSAEMASPAPPRTQNDAEKAVDLTRPAPPMIARTSQLVLVTKEFDKARGALEDILKRHGGYFGQLDVAAPSNSPRTLNATLRVPSNQLDPTMAEIKSLGQVESESQSGEEVTQQYVDLDARLTNARNTEQRLTTLLRDRTGKMGDVLAVEQEIDRVRGEIEQMEAQKKTLLNRVDFATLNVTLREGSQAQLSPRSTWERFGRAASDGYASLEAGIVGFLVLILAYGPSFVLWGGLAILISAFVWKKWRRLKFPGPRAD